MKLMVLLFGALTLTPFQAMAGGDVGNGGDSVECIESTESPYVGYFNLDYLFNVISDSEFAKDFGTVLAPGDAYDTQFRRIIEATQTVSPSFAKALTVYHENIFKNSSSATYTWKKAPYGVIELDDQNLRLKLPGNCLRSGAGKPFVQSVVRDSKPNQIEFTYYTEALKRLPPLQTSFLLFHEWFWNYTSDPEIVRNANAIIHSAGWSPETASKKLGDLFRTGLGFIFNERLNRVKPELYELSVSDDSIYVRNTSDAEIRDGVIFYSGKWVPELAAIRIANRTEKTIFAVPAVKSPRLSAMQIPVHQIGFAMLEKNPAAMRETYCIYFADSPQAVPAKCDPENLGTPKPKFVLKLDFH